MSESAFLQRVDALKKEGNTEPEIAKILGMTITEMRAARALIKRVER